MLVQGLPHAHLPPPGPVGGAAHHHGFYGDPPHAGGAYAPYAGMGPALPPAYGHAHALHPDPYQQQWHEQQHQHMLRLQRKQARPWQAQQQGGRPHKLQRRDDSPRHQQPRAPGGAATQQQQQQPQGSTSAATWYMGDSKGGAAFSSVQPQLFPLTARLLGDLNTTIPSHANHKAPLQLLSDLCNA
jgi:hypothetical protein